MEVVNTNLGMSGKGVHGSEGGVYNLPQYMRVDLLPNRTLGQIVEAGSPSQLDGTLAAVGIHHRQYQLEPYQYVNSFPLGRDIIKEISFLYIQWLDG